MMGEVLASIVALCFLETAESLEQGNVETSDERRFRKVVFFSSFVLQLVL